ncbi:MAG: trypsin-like peptidase domain-containing protein, partial [Trebonia sp.]
MTEPTTPRRLPRVRRTLAAALLAGTTLGAFTIVPTLSGVAQAQTQSAQTQSGGSGTVHVKPLTPPGPSTNGQAPVNQGHGMRQEVPNFVGLVKEVRPAVVTVTNYLKSGAKVEDHVGGKNGAHPQLPFPFNQFPFNQMPFGHPPEHAVEARGSGFVLNPDGLIVTNNHVVKDESRLQVTLADGTKYKATVVGTDPRTDIALIRIHADHPLPYLQLGDSNDVEPGEWVIAIGDPFGLSETVTAGIVSATGRNIGDGPYDRFIQVDAPINRGNSGGPLITQNGKVVGMNTAILSPSGGSVGIGFAIPSDMIRKITSDLEHYGHVTRGYLGVEAQSVSGAMSKALGLKSASGALIAQVEPNTPAAKAGVQPGDVIEKVNGKPIK